MLHGLHVPLWKLWTARPQNVFEIGQIEIGHRIRTSQGMPCKRSASYLDQVHTCYNTIVWDPEPPRINLPLVKRHECYKTNSESSPFVPASTVSKPVHTPSKILISWKHLYHVSTFLSVWIVNFPPGCSQQKWFLYTCIYTVYNIIVQYIHILASCSTIEPQATAAEAHPFLAGQHLTIQPLLQGSCRDLGKHGAWDTYDVDSISIIIYIIIIIILVILRISTWSH